MTATDGPITVPECRLTEASERSIRYLAQVNTRPVGCAAQAIQRLSTGLWALAAPYRAPLAGAAIDAVVEDVANR